VIRRRRHGGGADSPTSIFVVNDNYILLNFKDLVDYTVHFKGNQGSTEGQGVFTHQQDRGSWSLDLNQLDFAGNAFSGCANFRCLTATATFSFDATDYVVRNVQLSW
jgi:hypothetical protein